MCACQAKGRSASRLRISTSGLVPTSAASRGSDRYAPRQYRGDRLYQRGGGRRFELTFGFKDDVPITNVEKVGEQLCEFAKGLERAATGPLPPDAFGAIPELSFVELNAKKDDDAKWRNSEVHSVGLMSAKTLRKVIKEKERKCAGYDSCDAYWLLIVVDFMDRAQEQEIRLDDLPSIPPTCLSASSFSRPLDISSMLARRAISSPRNDPPVSDWSGGRLSCLKVASRWGNGPPPEQAARSLRR